MTKLQINLHTGPLKTAPQNKAYAFLERILRERSPSDTSPLPGIASLAHDAGTGYNTMWKVVRLLCARGILNARPRRGIHVLRHPSEPVPYSHASRPAARTRSTETAARIEHDIALGHLDPSTPLPSVKQLSARYGVSPRCARESLTHLAQESVICRDGRGYRARTVLPQRADGTIVLVTRGYEGGAIGDITPRTAGHIHDLETICSRVGVRLEITPVAYESPGFGRLDSLLSSRTRRERVLGFILWTTILNAEMLNRILLSIVPLGRPVAILDEINRLGMIESWRQAHIRRYSMAVSPLCGIRTGRYLRERGHRQIAYLSADSPQEIPDHISENRLNGLVESFGSLGPEGSVTRVLLPQSPNETDSATALADSVRNALPQGLVRGDILPSSVYQQIIRHCETAAILDRNVSALDTLLRDSSVSAWVCFNDLLAIHCKRFIESHVDKSKKAPLLVGFDDSREAFFERITSYNFNGAAFMRAMVDYILAPSRAPSGTLYQNAVELEGFVSSRE